MNILIVSSLPPAWCSYLGYNMAQRFKALGHNVDYLSKDEVDNKESWMYFVYPKSIKDHNVLQDNTILNRTWSGKMMQRLTECKNKAKIGIRRFLLSFYRQLEIAPLFSIVDEMQPVVPIEDFIKALPEKRYDKIYILFWYGMLSSLNIKVLIEKYDCEIIITNIDMSAMTGGCHYFGDCIKYKSECKGCPATRLSRYSSLPHKNYMFKKEIYKDPKIKFLVNKWSAKRYIESGLIKPEQIIVSNIHIDAKLYKPLDLKSIRNKLGLPIDKFIFFCGAVNPNEPRKGFKYLTKALNLFLNGFESPSNFILLIAGGKIDLQVKIETIHVGKLTAEQLSEYYAASDVFLSPSVDDTGPSMVNQSIMCGTPVVAFDVGTAAYDVITGVTGYRANYRESEDFCRGMQYLYHYSDINGLRKSCREYALKAFNQPLKTL